MLTTSRPPCALNLRPPRIQLEHNSVSKQTFPWLLTPRKIDNLTITRGVNNPGRGLVIHQRGEIDVNFHSIVFATTVISISLHCICYDFRVYFIASSWLRLSFQFCSLTKRSFKGFLLNVLKAGRCGPPRLVPPRPAHWFPRQNTANWKFPPKVPKFAQSSFKYPILKFLLKLRF